MPKPTAALVASAAVVFSTTLLVVAQQGGSPGTPVGSSAATSALAANPLAGNPDAVKAGALLFAKTCEKCHGPEGEGDSSAAPPLNTISFIHGYEDGEVFQTIRKGVEDTEMEPHPKFTDQQKWQLVSFVKSLASPTQARSYTDKYCIGCHGDWAKTGGVSLEGLSLKDVPAHGSVWEKVLRKVRSGEMPPQELARGRIPRPLARSRHSWKRRWTMSPGPPQPRANLGASSEPRGVQQCHPRSVVR